MSTTPAPVVQLSRWKFFVLCAAVAAAIVVFGGAAIGAPVAIAAEVFATILLLFFLGSFRYQLDKNALTYGAGLVIIATFFVGWWPGSALRQAVIQQGFPALAEFLRRRVLGFQQLDELVHLDTMLFILGLTFYVAVIAQSRMLESASFAVLRKNRGRVLPTVAILTAIVAFASGILDGVSMIGLMIRTLVIILFLAKAREAAVIVSVVLSTVVTTVCGMWLAYGEPPNLIMKANLHPHLTNAFFLTYCLPVAVGTYFVVLRNLRRLLKGHNVDVDSLDVLDLHTADLRFLQASRHGEVLTPVEFIENHREAVAPHFDGLFARLHRGESLGEAYVRENVPRETRLALHAAYASAELAEALDRHYLDRAVGKDDGRGETIALITAALDGPRRERRRAQAVGALSFLPFVALLIYHGATQAFPLFWASFAAFAVALLGIRSNRNIRKLALTEAMLEYREYLFLLPLFLSIALLQRVGFFDEISAVIQAGVERMGTFLVAFGQFAGSCFLSALLDNNVVADFASRALRGMGVGALHLFSMAQIAGYAAGGCWTHIGSAQSVVAYAFIRREIQENFTPVEWMKMMTPIILQIFVLVAVVIAALRLIPLFL